MRTTRRGRGRRRVARVLAVAPASARAADWVGLGDSFAAGPLIPNQTLNAARLPALDPQLLPARRPRSRRVAATTSPAAARGRRTCPARRAPTPAPTRRSSTRSSPPTRGRVAADRRQRHRLHGDPPELRDREPVRAPVPGPLRAQRRRRAARPDRRDGAEDRDVLRRHPRPQRHRARVLSSTTRRSSRPPGRAAGRRCRSRGPTCPTCAASSSQLNTHARAAGGARTARRSSTPTPLARPGRVQGLGHALGRAAGAGQRRRAVPPQRPRDGGRRVGRRAATANGACAKLARRGLDVAAGEAARPRRPSARTSGRRPCRRARSASARPLIVPLARISQVPSARLE